MSSIELGYRNYLSLLEENMPNCMALTESQLQDLYLIINDVFIMSEVISNLDDVRETANYYNLLKEFQSYIARLLLVVTLNDKYLVDTIIRLLVEKLYRVLYGLHRPYMQESSIRSHSRKKMSERLEGLLLKQEELNELYGEYSELIHHTSSTENDLLSLRSIYIKENEISKNTFKELERLFEVFIEDLFLKVVNNVDLSLSTRMTLSGRLSEKSKHLLLTHRVI